MCGVVVLMNARKQERISFFSRSKVTLFGPVKHHVTINARLLHMIKQIDQKTPSPEPLEHEIEPP